jgi:DUF1365 family protein
MRGATTEFRSALYVGKLVHRRFAPKPHRFAYPIYMHLFDLDELPELDRRLRLFGYNRPAPVSLYDDDHFGPKGRPLRRKLDDFHRDQGAEPPKGPVLLLTHARVFGYVFNPVSFFYGYDTDGRLTSVVAEVHNTFGERHTYLLDERTPPAVGTRRRLGRGGRSYSAPKALYVSPFSPPATRFDFHVTPPGAALSVHMDDVGDDGLLLDATLSGRRLPLTDGELLRRLVAMPFMTLSVIGRIHWQALRLWMKRVPHYRHRPRPIRETP